MNQSYDEYFDASSYSFQDERYGQDDEHRQWDSGGYYKSNSTTSKKLPAVPVVQNYLNKKRSSLIAQDVYTSCDGYLSSSTPKTRRKMPPTPTKRSSSRQSSLNDQEFYDGCCTPENTSHRGASLPPTPTKTPKVLARIAARTKPFNSLPPTPGRKLPQPNLNHRSAKARRNNLMKRTSSAEYPDYSNEDIYENTYIRPGAVSAREVYNEDYNYAYQSIDNLPNEQDELTMTPAVANSEYRTSVNVTVSQSNTFVPYKEQSTEEYYFSAQEERDYNTDQDYYEPKVKETSHKKKLLRGRGNSPLVQQHTDSLESRDDELKDSFETAVSSVSSSLHQQRRVPNYEPYVTAAETASKDIIVTVSQASLDISLKTSSVSNVQYRRDQPEPLKAIAAQNSTNTSVPDVTITEPNNSVIQAPSFKNGASRGYLVQQESVDSNYLQHQESLDDAQYTEPELMDLIYPDKINEEPYLEHQDSIESYVEDDPNDISADYTKAVNRDSPVSVIHVTEDDVSLRRGSSQVTVVDPYHPSLQRALEPYAPISTRRPSVDPYRAASPTRRTSGEAYQSMSSLKANDDYVPQRKSSIDPYQNNAPRRASVRHSPSPLEFEEQQDDHVPLDEDAEAKQAELEEEDEDIKPLRPQVTAHQRWLWAYNKIIMQLNVSTIFHFYFSSA